MTETKDNWIIDNKLTFNQIVKFNKNIEYLIIFL